MYIMARFNLLSFRGLSLRRYHTLLPTSVMLALVSSPCSPQASSSHSPSLPKSKTASTSSRKSSRIVRKQEASKEDVEDAVIFVRPSSGDGVTIGIAYSGRVSAATAEADVKRLCTAGQWQIAEPAQITNESVHPDRLKDYPPTTGVLFRAGRAPQVTDNAPNLLPYLRAFQRFRRFELNFEIEPLQPYRGVTRVENKVVGIQMLHSDGLYTFQISLHDHKENIPSLVNNGAAIDNTLYGMSAFLSPAQGEPEKTGQAQPVRMRSPRPPNMPLIIALALAVGTLVGGGIYVVMSRQAYR